MYTIKRNIINTKDLEPSGSYFKPLNLDKFGDELLSTDLGFPLDVTVDYNKSFKNGEIDMSAPLYTLNSVYSNKFQIQDSEPLSIPIKYRCECGEKKYRINVGAICAKCETEVKERNSDVRTTAVVRIPSGIRVLTSLGMLMLEKIVGGDTFKRFMGQPVTNKKKKIPTIDSYSLLQDKQLMEEFLSKYRTKTVTGDKEKELNFFLDNFDKLTTNTITIISSMLRPYSATIKNNVPVFEADSLSSEYTALSTELRFMGEYGSSMSLKDKRRFSKQLHKRSHKTYIEIRDKLGASKKKHMRGNILGIRASHTARLVIVPLLEHEHHQVNVVSLSHRAYRVIFKQEVKEKLLELGWKRVDIMRFLQAKDISKQELDLLNSILKRLNSHVLINRNPTISPGSIQCMKIVKLTNEMVMGIPYAVLPKMAADFDKYLCRDIGEI